MLERVQLDDAWAYRDAVDGRLHGASEERLRAELERADALVNVSAVTVLGEEHMQVPVRIYLETDPVLAQIEIAQGNQRTIGLLAAHTHHFTYGENFGAPGLHRSAGAVHLSPDPPAGDPGLVGRRPGDGPPRPSFTTVASWKQTAKDIEWQGELLTWSKDVQFQHVLDLPQPGEPAPRARPGHRRRRGCRQALSGGMERRAGPAAVRRPRPLPRLRARLGG